MDTNYSTYFSVGEMLHTDVEGCKNIPSCWLHWCNLFSLACWLDDIREELGHPIYVNSAYRSTVVNQKVGGVPRSLHCQGRAADIWCDAEHVDELIDILRNHRDQLSEFIVNKDKKYIHIAR